MKKYIINFITIVLLFILTSNCSIFAEKIICEVRNENGIVDVFLFSYDDKENNLGYIWVKTLVEKELTDEQIEFLNQINDIQIVQQDQRYEQIRELTKQLEDLDYNPLQPFAFNSQIPKLNTEIFEILGSFLE